MPFYQRKTWVGLQGSDSIHAKLKHLISIGQCPEKRKTRGDATKLKLLYNLFTRGDLRVEKDGLITVKTKAGVNEDWAISIPPSLFPGIAQALHIRFSHPSKLQLSNIMARYFYCPGHQAIINDIVDSCKQCLTLKSLPKVLDSFETSPPGSFGSRLSIDIIERCGQKILVTVEDGSHQTFTSLIDDQRADTIKTSVLSHILPLITLSGTVLRTDNAPSFNSLAIESTHPDSIWAKYNIRWEMGDRYNPNKNPIVENKIREISKEILKFKSAGGPISELDLIEVTHILNTRVRHHGHASREIFLRRDLLHNKPIDVMDEDISKTVESLRKDHHADQASHLKNRGAKTLPEVQYQVGDLVLVRDMLSKHSPREIHTVVEVKGNGNYAIKKLENQIRQKTFNVKHTQLILYSNYRPGPEKSADEESALEKIKTVKNESEDKPAKRQKMSASSTSSLEFNLLNNNVIEVDDSPNSSKDGPSEDITIDSRSEHISARKPAGKGAPVKSLRSKRRAAAFANQRLKEMHACLRVYTEYLHGWKYEDNNDVNDDQFVYGQARISHTDPVNDNLGIVNGDRRLNDLVATYQEFLSQENPSQEPAPDSMLPNHDLTNETINTDSLDHYDTTPLSPDLQVPTDSSLTQDLDQIHFNIGVSSTSTVRTRAGRSVLRRDYREADSSGF